MVSVTGQGMAANPQLTILGAPAGSSRKRLIRRASPDNSQAIRRVVQVAFLVLNLVIGIQFYAFVRYCESGGIGSAVSRPPGVEGWLPIASLMNLKSFVLTGHLPVIMPAGMFLLLCFAAISVLLRKAFCSWLCPVGTVSEALWKLGRRLLRRNIVLPRWLDLFLRPLKYVLLGLFLWAVGSMPVDGIEQFLHSPFGLIADVKMLNFFRHMSQTAAVTLVILGVLSILIQNFWCRYLCPYGALMGLASLFSPAAVRRNADICIDCGKCSGACPSRLPVDRLVTIRSAECTACVECVAVCPAEQALELSYPRGHRISPAAAAAIIAVLFLGTVTMARVSGHWRTDLPSRVYFDLVPQAANISHP